METAEERKAHYLKLAEIYKRNRVVARCVGCSSQRDVGPNEEYPMCGLCGMPMIAKRAFFS